jgi:hypothetical protein
LKNKESVEHNKTKKATKISKEAAHRIAITAKKNAEKAKLLAK